APSSTIIRSRCIRVRTRKPGSACRPGLSTSRWPRRSFGRRDPQHVADHRGSHRNRYSKSRKSSRGYYSRRERREFLAVAAAALVGADEHGAPGSEIVKGLLLQPIDSFAAGLKPRPCQGGGTKCDAETAMTRPR